MRNLLLVMLGLLPALATPARPAVSPYLKLLERSPRLARWRLPRWRLPHGRLPGRVRLAVQARSVSLRARALSSACSSRTIW